MQRIIKEIDEELYERVTTLPHKDQENALFPDGIPISWQCGYGYYGHSLFRADGKCYAQYTIGDSCD